MGTFLDFFGRFLGGPKGEESGNLGLTKSTRRELFRDAQIPLKYADIVLSFLVHIVINQERSSKVGLSSQMEICLTQLFNELHNLLVRQKKASPEADKSIIVLRLQDLMNKKIDEASRVKVEGAIIGKV